MTQTADERREARRLAKQRQRQRDRFRADVQQWLSDDIEQAAKMLRNDPELFNRLEDAYREQYPPLERGNGNNTYPVAGQWETFTNEETGESTRANNVWSLLYGGDGIPADPADFRFHVTALDREILHNLRQQAIPRELLTGSEKVEQ